jgi:hypothetical protein
MFIVALCTIARKWQQTKCPSIHQRIKKMWSIYTNAFSLKKNEYLPFEEKQMELEIFVLSEVSETQKR